MMGNVAIWAFIIGILMALIVGLYQANTLIAKGNLTDNNFLTSDTGSWVAWVLVAIGGIVGVLAVLGKGIITKQEVPGFLIAGVALLVMYGVFGSTATTAHLHHYLGGLLIGVSTSLALFITPVVGLLALKAVWDIGKSV